MLFTRREKAVKGQSIFANMRVDKQSYFAVQFAKRGKRGKRDGDEIPNAANIDNDLIRTFIEEAATEESDHRLKVLLCCVEVSTMGSAVRLSKIPALRPSRRNEE
jgi:hypothetical protein